MNQNEFDVLIDKVVSPSNMIPYIIEKMILKPELLTGFKKINTFSLRLYASFGQANNIKYGNILEAYFQKYLEQLGWELLPRDYELTQQERVFYNNDSNRVNIDIIARFNDKLIFIEQKILDNHDSTKKIGQLRNFQEKATVVSRNYSGYSIYGFEWFIDDSQRKNGANWAKHNSSFIQLNQQYIDRLYVMYGQELEKKLTDITGVDHSGMLLDFEEKMKTWHINHGKELPELIFDKLPMDVVDELKKYPFSRTYKMFSNTDLNEQIFPILFPNKQVHKAYYSYLQTIDTTSLNKRETDIFVNLKSTLEKSLDIQGL